MTIDKQWYVYLLLCSDHSIYTGITNDLDKRITTHNSGKGAKYTKARLPVILITAHPVPNKSQALKLEYLIKTLSHKQKLDFIPTLPIP